MQRVHAASSVCDMVSGYISEISVDLSCDTIVFIPKPEPPYMSSINLLIVESARMMLLDVTKSCLYCVKTIKLVNEVTENHLFGLNDDSLTRCFTLTPLAHKSVLFYICNLVTYEETCRRVGKRF